MEKESFRDEGGFFSVFCLIADCEAGTRVSASKIEVLAKLKNISYAPKDGQVGSRILHKSFPLSLSFFFLNGEGAPREARKTLFFSHLRSTNTKQKNPEKIYVLHQEKKQTISWSSL